VWPVTALESKTGGQIPLELIRKSGEESSINSFLLIYIESHAWVSIFKF